MRATTFTSRTVVLSGALFQLFAPRAPAAQRTTADSPMDRLPVSVSLPLVIGWAESAPHPGFGFSGVTVSAHVSPTANAGISVRHWYGYVSREPCGLTRSECAIGQQTTSLALLAHGEFYPLHGGLFFVRVAAGVSRRPGPNAPALGIYQSPSRAPTLLPATGWGI